jgi:hypothetical protein
MRRLGHKDISPRVVDEARSGEILAAAFPDRVALRQDQDKYRFASGREAFV